MRVLVTSTPGAGHAYPVMPLATDLQQAGHEVLWATAEDGAALVRAHGFDVAVAGMNLQDRRAFLEPRLPEILQLPTRLRRGHLFSGFFARAAAPKMAVELEPIVERFRPDVVMHEWGEQAAAPIATARSIPHATIAFSGALPEYAVAMAEDALEPLWSSFGLPRPSLSDMAGDVYFHPFPKSMGQSSALDQARELRPTTSSGLPGDVPQWLGEFGRDRKAIYVTAGTTPIVAAMAPWKSLFEAMASLDVDVLATVGPQIPFDDLGPIPSNVRVERFVPQHFVLGRVALVVSHAGAGTILAAAASGVPHLAIPTWADQWENSDAHVQTGAGLMLEENERHAEPVRSAILRILTNDAFSVAAAQLALEIATMPSSAEHVHMLEQLQRS